MKINFYLLVVMLLLCSCGSEPERSMLKAVTVSKEPRLFTKYSEGENKYVNFNSVHAINKIAEIENEYFTNSANSISKYYGTVWRQGAEQTMINDSTTQYQDYLEKLDRVKPDSLHCTLYAYEALKAGLGVEKLNELERIHHQIWKSREIAGWSVGYILVNFFNWKAYLVIHPKSNEYEHCMNSFEKNKAYPVWKQPDIPLEEVFIVGDQDTLINRLLERNEFSWGFSEQGIHTWITRYDKLKECNWLGSPSKLYEYNEFDKPLFITTEFGEYRDYDSHVLIIPQE